MKQATASTTSLLRTLLNTFTIVAFVMVSLTNSALAQNNLGINTTPHTSAALDVTFPAGSPKGMLVPRMTLVQRNAITTPATGLLIFQTDGTTGFYFYNGTAWTVVGKGSATSIPNAFTGHATNTSVTYASPFTSVLATSGVFATTTYYAPENATLTINIYSYVGSAFTLELYTVAPNATNTFATSGTPLATANIAAWSSGSPSTGTITYTISAGTIYTIKASATTAGGIYYTSTNAQ